MRKTKSSRPLVLKSCMNEIGVIGRCIYCRKGIFRVTYRAPKDTQYAIAVCNQCGETIEVS